MSDAPDIPVMSPSALNRANVTEDQPKPSSLVLLTRKAPFLTNVTIVNIAYTRRQVISERSLGFLRLTSAAGGKSTFILSLMLGLGYDLIPAVAETQTRHTTMCGLYIDQILRSGTKNGSIELTMSLRDFPTLEREYGSHMKFARTFKEGLRRSFITLSSADPDIGSAIRPHCLQTGELEYIYQQMHLSIDSFRLMFLNMENVNYLIDRKELWYSFIKTAVTSQNICDDKLKEMNFLLERHRRAEKLKVVTTDYLREQIRRQSEISAQLETEELNTAKKNDEIEFSQSLLELDLIFNERRELERKRKHYAQELELELLEACVARMVLVFNEFLQQLDLRGHIVIRHSERKVAMCALDLNSPKALTEFEQVENHWWKMSRGKKMLTMFGFYLSLWEVSNYLPLFAADAFSSTCGDFMVPERAHPVLLRILEKKVQEGKQCFVTLPPPPPVPVGPTATPSPSSRVTRSTSSKTP